MALKKGTEIATIDVNLVTLITADATPVEIAIATATKLGITPEIETTDAIKLIIKGVLKAQKPSEEVITGHTITLTDNMFTPEIVKILQGGTITYGPTTFGSGNAGFTLTPKLDSCTFTAVKPDTASAALSVVVTGNDIVVNLATDAGKAVTTTASALKTALEGNVSANALVTVGLTGTGATAVVAYPKTTISVITGYEPPTVGSGVKGTAFKLAAYTAQRNAAGDIVQYEKIEYPNCKGTPITINIEDGSFRVSEYTIKSTPNSNETPYKISYLPTLPVVV